MKKLLIIGLFFLGALKVFSQTPHLSLNTDNTGFFVKLENEQLKNLDSLYVALTSCKTEFINGRNYLQYFSLSNHKPLLYSDKKRTSSLIFKGRLYNNIVLQYDTYLDLVIYEDKGLIFNRIASQIALNSDNISQFDLYLDNDTLLFRYFSDRIDHGFNLEPGFYELVYDGRCKYLLKHKSIRYKLNGIDEYWYEPVGFVRVEEKYVRISSPKQFANLFGKASLSIRKFITRNNIRIREADKNQIADILRFYESIDNNGR